MLSRTEHPSLRFPDWSKGTPFSWMSLSSAIHQWSWYSFGEQISNVTGEVMDEECPYKGIFEEYLEYRQAKRRGTSEAILDALADMGVFLLDWSARHNLDLTLDLNLREKIYLSMYFHSGYYNLENQLEDCLEEFVRTDLKSHQGIRGYSFDKMPELTFRLLAALSAIYFDLKYGKEMVPEKNIVEAMLDDFKGQIQETFFTEVFPRDWVLYPGKGKP